LPPEPLILGFDTSAAHCAAALRSGSDIIARAHEPMQRGQAERLVPLLEEMLNHAGAGWRDLHAVGVGIGPGNFTGVRIAVSAARGMALALGIPAIGVSSFEALAEGHVLPVMVLVGAPRGHVHAQIRTAPLAGKPSSGDSPRYMPLADALAQAGATGLPVIGPDALIRAEAITAAAARRLAAGRVIERPKPLYLRAADAAPPRERPPPILP